MTSVDGRLLNKLRHAPVTLQSNHMRSIAREDGKNTFPESTPPLDLNIPFFLGFKVKTQTLARLSA